MRQDFNLALNNDRCRIPISLYRLLQLAGPLYGNGILNLLVLGLGRWYREADLVKY